MISQKKYISIGWFFSIVIHVLLIWFAFLTPFSVKSTPPDFTEISWGPINEALLNENIPLSTPTSGASGIAQKEIEANNIISLPKRSNLVRDEEKINSPTTSKKESEDYSPTVTKQKNLSTSSELTNPIGTTKGKIKGEITGEDLDGSNIVSSPYKGGISTKSATDVGFNIQWSGTFTRSIYNKVLPKFPDKVSQQAQIKIKVTVAPNGTVKDSKPLQKENPALEQVSINAIAQWVFEPLQSSFPQKDQTCIITFNFVVK
ncbi:MAG: hypothetical protein EXR24_01115 [Ignavibacteria bacterium]|nr:hypothetical protein [Bacteroidota bacterium]MSQ45570.1 hypothetical protein [Ignavibacteria bacterium]